MAQKRTEEEKETPEARWVDNELYFERQPLYNSNDSGLPNELIDLANESK